MKTKLSSYLEYFTGIVGKCLILQKNIQLQGYVGADLKLCMLGQWMRLVSHCRKVRHSYLYNVHTDISWLFFFCYYIYTLILVEKTQVEPEIQTLYRLMNCTNKYDFVIHVYPCRMHLWFVCYSNMIYATDVGFKVGGDSDIKYLVLQVHYKNVDNFLPPSKYCMDTSQKYCQPHPEIVLNEKYKYCTLNTK